MSGLIALLIVSILLFLGTLLASFVPHMLALKRRKIKQLSTLGTGLLVGAALGIVVPEGAETVCEHAGQDAEMGQVVGFCLVLGFMAMFLLDSFQPHPSIGHTHTHAGEETPKRPQLSPRGSNGAVQTRESARELLPRVSSSHGGDSGETSLMGAKWSTTLIALCVHSLADGLSLGASFISQPTSSTGNGRSLSAVVVLALVMHKLPTALALSSVLRAHNVPRALVRRALVAFAAAAPLAALVTYGALSLFANKSDEAGSTQAYATGLVLLFSGGTFLFVATHLMRESNEPQQGCQDEEDDEEAATRGWRGPALVVVGMVIPGILSALLGHGH